MSSQIDLSQPIKSDMQPYPGDPPVGRVAHATHTADGYRAETLSLTSHTGTHIDAPLHTEADGNSLADYELDRFVFDAVRVDCRGLDPREAITPALLPDPDAAAGADMVVFWTGWDRHWGTDRYLDHPFLDPTAATECADWGLSVGLDALNPDPTPTANAVEFPTETTETEPDGLPAHHALLGADCLIIENLRNLDSVADRFELRAYPLALDGDGSPIRAVAVDQNA